MVRASIFKGKTSFILRLAHVSWTRELEDVLLQWESTHCLVAPYIRKNTPPTFARMHMCIPDLGCSSGTHTLGFGCSRNSTRLQHILGALPLCTCFCTPWSQPRTGSRLRSTVMHRQYCVCGVRARVRVRVCECACTSACVYVIYDWGIHAFLFGRTKIKKYTPHSQFGWLCDRREYLSVQVSFKRTQNHAHNLLFSTQKHALERVADNWLRVVCRTHARKACSNEWVNMQRQYVGVLIRNVNMWECARATEISY